MRKLIPLLAAGALSLGAVLASPNQAAAQPMPAHWGYGGGHGGGYYAPPPPPPPYYGRPHWHRPYGGPPPWAYAPPPRPYWGGAGGYYRY
ncbi:hypothetical protein JMJ55_03230 [Belnapia sp. T6]|uniref:Uncharacterized protein n=1 Tax=Belnapia mucosa TaxID=2804532 RepID=A0ABS1UXX2_9PROT|nr:hypothetical protein [Belnapia mucosa]MBL6454321.1 hypothetical protein [Belnapia mucosa]